MTATIDKTLRPATAIRPSFQFLVAAAMCVFIFGGFGMTYWQPMAAGNFPPAPPLVHIHGIVFSCWMILLLTQSILVNVKKVALHRSLGMFGISLATALIVIGLLISLMSGSTGPDGPFYYDLMYLSYSAVSIFTLLFILAIRRIRKPADHRLLILMATIPLLPPGINRMYMELFNLDFLPVLATYLTMDLFVIALVFNDWRVNKTLSNAAVTGAVFVVGVQLLHIPLTNSDAFAEFTRITTSGWVHYR